MSWVAVVLLAAGVAWATPTGTVTYPAYAGVYDSIDHVDGTATPTSGYNVTSVYLALSRIDPATYLQEYWNWATLSWGTWNSSECRTLATGTTSWQVISGLPTVWDRPWQHVAWAYVYDSSPAYATVDGVFFIGTTRPSCSISYPVNGGTYEYIEQVTGTASGAGGDLDWVGVVLQRNYSETWYWWDWAAQGWRNYSTDPFDAVRAYTVATGTDNWAVAAGLPWTWYKGQSYRVLARAFNTDGAFSIDLAMANFTVQSTDVTWPDLSIECPANNQWYYPGPEHIAGTASDDGTGIAAVRCYLLWYDPACSCWEYWNWVSHGWQTSSSADCFGWATGTEEWEVNSNLPEWVQGGHYRTVVYAYDHVGNYRYLSRYFYAGDNAAPQVAVTYPEAYQLCWPDHIAGTADDGDGSGVELVKCYLAWYDVSYGWKYWNWVTQAWETGWSLDRYGPAIGTDQWEANGGLPEWLQGGSYAACGIAYDRVGNYRQSPWQFFYTGDYTCPTGTIDCPEEDEWYYPGITRIAGTAADEGGSGVEKVMCYLGWWDGEAMAMKWWNWVAQAWEPQQPAPYPEEWLALAEGTTEWEITSGLPNEWPLCRRYVALAIVYDKMGNQLWQERHFYVGDHIAPVITQVTASPDTLWPPNHKMVDVTIFVNATDDIDPAPVSRITGVTASEPVDGPGDGSTRPDWEITGDLTLKLRAERAGPSTGRIYTVTVTCTDFCGNSSSATVDVTVPHDSGH